LCHHKIQATYPGPVRTDIGPLFGLAPDGVYIAISSYLKCGELLPHLFTLTSKRRFVFCCTFRRLTSPRSYLASCPKEPGLSSQLRAIIQLTQNGIIKKIENKKA
tara:strand:- start:1022 stop:1336 length:315 start_codon:yes stop_codon:yes gene_type:complete